MIYNCFFERAKIEIIFISHNDLQEIFSFHTTFF